MPAEIYAAPTVVLWSAMRSGSTEFAQALAVRFGWAYVGEPFNFRPKGVRASPWTAPARFLAELARGRILVFKVFPGHLRGAALPLHCAVVLERRPIAARWCSLQHARRTREWTGRTRRNCTDDASMPASFERAHRRWFEALLRRRHGLYLTFDDVVRRRNESLWRVGRHCAPLVKKEPPEEPKKKEAAKCTRKRGNG